MTKKWKKKLPKEKSLNNAGVTIGRIERVLILIFILIGQWEAIGFLLAAKSVFRFGDLKDQNDQMKTEYILVGTMLSFTFSVVLGILTCQIIEHL